MNANKWLVVVAMVGLLGSVAVQAVEESSSPAAVPAVQPAISAPAQVKEDKQVLRTDRKKLHQDREKLEADIKQYGKESSQVKEDRAQLKQDRGSLKAARGQMKHDKNSVNPEPASSAN